jgi:hypothetical protein
MVMKNSFLIVFSFILLFSCAQKPTKTRLVKRDNKVRNPDRFPEFEVKNIELVASRKIASLVNKKKDSERKLAEIYFLSLYQQVQYFNQALGIKSKKLICPKFHNQMLDYESHQISIKSVRTLERSHNHPLTTEKESAYESIASYNEINNKELQELCNYGDSDGFYRFVNLSKYYSSYKDIGAKNMSIIAYFKVPVVANIYFLNQLRSSKGNLEMSPIEKQLLSAMNAELIERYLYTLNLEKYSGNKYSYNRD